MARRKTQITRLPVFPFDYKRRMNIMLNVFRHEPATVLLGYLMDHEGATASKLNSRMQQFTEQKGIGTREYLRDVLTPASLVDEIGTGLREDRPLYTLKKSGRDVGIPAAEFTVRYSVDNDFWLGDVFGRSIVKDIKTCGRRYIILNRLSELGSSSTKLNLQLDTKAHYSTVSRDLADLVSLGLVDSESLDIDSIGYHSVSWKGKECVIGPGKRNVKWVSEFLQKSRNNISLKEIAREIQLPAADVMSALFSLSDRGLLSFHDTFPIKKKYDISMSKEGRKHWEGYFVPLSDFLRGRSELPLIKEENRLGLFEEREFMPESISDARKAIEIYKDRTGK
jgi:predicted transcriptional regulator